MKITVNNTPVEVHSGARVKDVILKFYALRGRKVPSRHPLVTDRFGNEVADDGELTDGNTLFIKAKSKKLSLLPAAALALVSVLLLSAFSGGKCSGVAAQDEKQAVIFAVNDMHATLDNFPKLAYLVDSLRKVYPGMLLVSAGDNQTGNPVNDQYPERGYPMIDLMNTVGFNLSAVGNHEFDCTPKGFAGLTHKAGFDFLCANVIPDNSLDIRLSPYKIITLPNGLRLAFFSLLQINQNGIPDTHPDNTHGFTFLDPFKTAREYLFLKDKCDILIALTHLGFESDVMLADSMPAGIDLIIGGHSHTLVRDEQIHNNILITQAGSKLKFGTLIKLTLGSDGSLKRTAQLIDIKDAKKEDPSVRAIVDKYNDNPTLKTVIATATDDFSSSEELGYLMADAQRAAAGADIALLNPGGVRMDRLPKGAVTVMNVYQLDPFGNELVLTTLTGKEILSLMKAAYSIDDNSPLLPSGITIKVKLGTDGHPADFILTKDDGTPLSMDKTYTVAMNNYMTSVYKYQHADPGRAMFMSTADALMSYLKKQQNIRSYRGEKRVEILK